MVIKTFFVNTLPRRTEDDKVIHEGGVLRAKGASAQEAWRLYFELEEQERVRRLHKKVEDAHAARTSEPEEIPAGLEGHYYL